MIKKILYHILFAINVIALFLAILSMILFAKGRSFEDIEALMMWRMNATYGILVFWIWNMIIWSKFDKKIIRFVALFFLPGLFTMYYYFFVLKHAWLDRTKQINGL